MYLGMRKMRERGDEAKNEGRSDTKVEYSDE